MAEKQIVMYSMPTWPYCKRAKEYFSQKGIEYTDIDVSDREKAKEMVAKSGQINTPAIFIDDEMVIGFQPEKLDELLKDWEWKNTGAAPFVMTFTMDWDLRDSVPPVTWKTLTS